MCSSAVAEQPSSSSGGTPRRWSSTRSTIFSPKIVRSVEARKSTSSPFSSSTRMRPSCGRRFSAMSIPAITFIRAASPSVTHFGRSMTSLSRPSRRCRTVTPWAPGSMWMSLAPLLSALRITRFTRSTIGAISEPPAGSSSARPNTLSSRECSASVSNRGTSLPPPSAPWYDVRLRGAARRTFSGVTCLALTRALSGYEVPRPTISLDSLLREGE